MPRSAKLATSEALHEVKPLCIQLLKDQSKENVTILRCAIEQLSDEACQELHQYLLLPLVLVLKKENKHEALVIETIASIRFVLEKTCVNDEKLFSDIFLQLLIVVTTLSDCLQVSSTSEELKLEVCSALKTLIENAHPCVLLQFYDIGFRLRLSHGVTILIQLAEKERNRQLQVASMECLAALACNNVSDVFKSEILFQKVGGAFAGFFPGISLALTRVILSAENKSQNVTVHALKTWGHITHLVLGDAYLEATSPVDEVTKLNEKSPPEQVPIIFRNEEWAKSTAEKLTILVDKVMPILLQCGERVKLATLDWARTLLLQCSRSLEILTPSILQAVLSLCADDSERVSRQGHLVLDEVGNQMLVLDSLSLIEILEEDFHKTLSRFPRLLRMGSESEKLTLVKLLCGYLKVFRAKISKILMSTAVSQKLLGVLFLLTELETRDMKIFTEQAAPLDFPTTADPVCSYRNQFVHFTDMQIFKEFTVICKLLATYGDVTMLTDILCQKIQESASHRKQAILVLSNILRSLAEDRPDSCAELDLPGFIGSLLGYFVSNSLWNLLLTSSEAWEDPVDTMQACSLQTVSLDKINSNILQSCLLLEGVTVLAQLSKEEFRPLLRICLCPLLEKAASQNHLVSHVACTTLFHVSNACGYRSISELIQQNADYIVNAVLFKLRHPSCHSDVTRIVQALAKHSDSSAISLLVDVGHEVLHALDFCHRDNALPFLKVLESIVMYLNTWFPGMAKKDTLENGSHIKATMEKTFVQFVEDFHHCKNLSPDVKITDEELESSDVPEENVYSMETDEKPPVPGYVKLLVEVLKRCMHLQSSSNIYVRTVVLSTISQAVVPLSSCEDELLPVVHLLWKPLVARFKKDDWNLSVKAFQTVMSLAEVARDFIRERVLLEVWPWLAGFLRSQHAVRDKGKAYEVTAAFKYQLALLQGLGPLSVQLKVHEQGIALLASAVLPYLEQSQPPRLQEAATECLQGLSRCSADSVWYFVATTYSTTQTCWSPAAPLEPLPLTSAIGLDSNVTQLVAYLSNMDKQSLN